MSVDIAKAERSPWLKASNSSSYVCSSDVYRHESSRGRSLPFFLKYYIIIVVKKVTYKVPFRKQSGGAYGTDM